MAQAAGQAAPWHASGAEEGRGGEEHPDVPWRGKDGLEGCDKGGVRKAAPLAFWQGMLFHLAAESPARPP